MKKVSTFFLLVFVLMLASCKSEETQTPDEMISGDANVLITYFSWSNNTQVMANYIKDLTNGDLFRLVPDDPYTTNYNELLNIAQDERRTNARPALASNLTAEQIENYDIIFVGYPIWWNDAPMIIYTFLEAHNFTGKTIIPFATSGGSGISASKANISRICEGASVLDGLVLSGSNINNLRSQVATWIDGLNLPTSSVEGTRISMSFNNNTITVALVDNPTTRDLVSRLKQGPLTLTFSDFAGSEKIAYIDPRLDVSEAEGCDPVVGDITIYTPWGNLAAFYKDSSGYSSALVLIGHIEDDGITILATQNDEYTATLELR